MSKRFTATEIWSEDWFLEMPVDYKLFWFYLKDNCDHSGLFRVNMRSYCGLTGAKVTPDKVLEYFNAGKQRIRVVNQSIWLLEDFFVFQYGSKFNANNNVHASILELYEKAGVEVSSIRGLSGLKPRDIYKDKDIDKDINQKEGEKWNSMPGEEALGIELPEIKAGAATLLFHAATHITLTPEQLNTFWEIFKKQNFTGAHHYPKISDTYSHFINWIKLQKVNGTNINGVSQNSKSASAHKLANRVAGFIPNKP